MPTTLPSRVDISAVIENEPFSRFQRVLVATCFVLMMLDTINLTLIGFAAPAIAAAWHLKLASFGPVFGAGLLASLLGALIFGSVADALGRRPTIIVGVALFAVFTLLLPTARSLQGLMVYRFLIGLGLGGVPASCVAMTAEYSPARIRPMMISVMVCGLPVGSMLAGMIAFFMMPSFGWKAVFYLGGVVPLVLIPFLIWQLPESVRFLILKKNDSPQVARTLRKIAPAKAFADTDVFLLTEQKASGFPAKGLFTEGRLLATLLIWLVFFAALLELMLFNQWLPSLLRQSGIPLQRAIFVGWVFFLGGIIGALVVGWCGKHVDASRVLGWVFVGTTLSVFSLGLSQGHAVAVVIVAFFAGFFINGATVNMHVVASAAYPTVMRSTGVGWASGVGRIGSIIGPVVAGMLLSTGITISALMYVSALPAVLGVIASFVLAKKGEHGVNEAPLTTAAKKGQ